MGSRIRQRIVHESKLSPTRSLVLLVELILEDAYASGASDIHIDPYAEHLQVRVRIDGLLHDAYVLPLNCHAELISRLKILSGLRTDEHTQPQDGRFTFTLAEEIDVRVSILMTHYGENAVLRLLVRNTRTLSLLGLGIQEPHTAFITKAINASHGLILVVGPTGSGKTTTLYALMACVSMRPIAAVSMEDPIEYALPRVRQITAGTRIGTSFGEHLRALLRQDPDVIMVGEIRDADVAQTASQAAMTGHLVLSSIHANGVGGVFERLTGLGVDAVQLSSSVRLIIGQRLVRKLCDACKESDIPTSHELNLFTEFGVSDQSIPARIYRGTGCHLCDGSGYRGRIGIFEISRFQGGLPIRICSNVDDAMQKVLEGITTVEEVHHALYA